MWVQFIKNIYAIYHLLNEWRELIREKGELPFGVKIPKVGALNTITVQYNYAAILIILYILLNYAVIIVQL